MAHGGVPGTRTCNGERAQALGYPTRSPSLLPLDNFTWSRRTRRMGVSIGRDDTPAESAAHVIRREKRDRARRFAPCTAGGHENQPSKHRAARRGLARETFSACEPGLRVDVRVLAAGQCRLRFGVRSLGVEGGGRQRWGRGRWGRLGGPRARRAAGRRRGGVHTRRRCRLRREMRPTQGPMRRHDHVRGLRAGHGVRRRRPQRLRDDRVHSELRRQGVRRK